MIGFAIRSLLAAGMLFLTVYSFYTGYWGWGIFLIFPTALVILSFNYNENLAFTLNHMRTGNQDKAQRAINRITAPQFLPKRQRAYVIYMQALLNAQAFPSVKIEGMLREAIQLGLKRGHDKAMARMHLAGLCVQSGRRQEAVTLLAEAKKMDDSGMLKDQIKMMQSQMQNAPSKNQMRMAQMMGGRKKTPKMR
ncbi:hypothetical protein [Fluviicola taffensis]|uniref:DUF2892 domain-containing protein n=1 Tax=Fluviicola taffensis (strain DSM 16823 / NCIMB 13979 / RW262) TaxID=755732 RepID=F2IBD9_FLUTR|nr:hypothetical protein [Fluviicola taffensis]AEA43225.1 hypothetical protein Fluta_1230 [Fluviicola taffensis DSM 16823]